MKKQVETTHMCVDFTYPESNEVGSFIRERSEMNYWVTFNDPILNEDVINLRNSPGFYIRSALPGEEHLEIKDAVGVVDISPDKSVHIRVRIALWNHQIDDLAQFHQMQAFNKAFGSEIRIFQMLVSKKETITSERLKIKGIIQE